jgi:hypothetical protein
VKPGWQFSWAALGTALFGVLLWSNWRKYQGRSPKFIIGKATLSTLLFGGLALIAGWVFEAFLAVAFVVTAVITGLWMTHRRPTA